MFDYQRLYFFDNGYGASVIQNKWSFGHEEGLYELAVIQGVEDDWHLCYDTYITDDVMGDLTPREVVYILRQIKSLEGETNGNN